MQKDSKEGGARGDDLAGARSGEPRSARARAACDLESSSNGPGNAGRVLRFLLVGASGLGVNQGLLMLLHGSFQWPLALASVTAVECSILTNFTLNSLWTWRDHAAPAAREWVRRGLQYHVVTLAAGITNVVGVVLMAQRLKLDFRLANLLAIAAGSLVTYLASDRWVFRRHR